jgi:hypothetical protein
VSQRLSVDRQRIEQFLKHLGRRFRRPGRVYLVGGTTSVFEGLRPQTVDIDLTYEIAAEDQAAFIRTVRELKQELAINVEEVSPGDFIPLPTGYRERCRFIGRYGQLDVFHFDLYSTALSKIERGTEGDFADVLALLRTRQIEMETLNAAFAEILPQMASASLKQDPQEFERKFAALNQMWQLGSASSRR